MSLILLSLTFSLIIRDQTSWFPFFLFDTDWMGREVFHGDPKGDVSEVQAYNEGVREGAFGLILNSVRTQLISIRFSFYVSTKIPFSNCRVYHCNCTSIPSPFLYVFCLFVWQVVLGISSFFIEPMCQWMGARLVWAASNFIVFACMAGTALIGFVSVRQSSEGVQHVIGANGATKIASLVVFALLGLPLSVSILMLDFHPPSL